MFLLLELTIMTFSINLYSHWLARGEPEGKVPSIRAPLTQLIQNPAHDNQCNPHTQKMPHLYNNQRLFVFIIRDILLHLGQKHLWR